MKSVDLYGRVRRAVLIDGMSRREAARLFGVDRRTVDKMLLFSIPPGYRRTKSVKRPKLDPFVGIIDVILETDKTVPRKQKHTSKRVFERLRDEHGYAGGITVVKDYIFAARQRQREMFVPLAHPPGHAQADFGEALAIIGGTGARVPWPAAIAVAVVGAPGTALVDARAAQPVGIESHQPVGNEAQHLDE